MKVQFYIINGESIAGIVYENENGNKIIWMRDNVLNVEDGIIFMTKLGATVEDIEVMDILVSFFKGVR